MILHMFCSWHGESTRKMMTMEEGLGNASSRLHYKMQMFNTTKSLEHKTRPEGVKTAPTAFQIRRRPSHQAEKTPEPLSDPYTVAFLCLSENWAGARCPQCFGYGTDDGIFFNLSLKLASTGSWTQDLRSTAGVLWPTGLEALWQNSLEH
jgi:hypothetical protein